MSSTATLVHTSSRAQDNADRIARVAAANRVRASRLAAERARVARERKARVIATAWAEDIRAAGAVEVGFKVCDDLGKHRFRMDLADAVEFLTRNLNGDVEAWGITADGGFAGEVW